MSSHSLNNLCSKITDGAHHSPKAEKDGFPMFSVKDMLDYDFDYSKCKTISEDDYIKLINAGCQPEVGDVVIAKDGSVLKHIFHIRERPKYVLLSSIAILRPIQSLVDAKYLVYSLKNPNKEKDIRSNYVSGSGVPRIVLKDFGKVKINLPPLPEQKAIAKILGDLDDKIELNRKMNETLEQMAQALFQSWFVDFDPVIDNALAAGNEIPDALKVKAEKRKLVHQGKPIKVNVDYPSEFVFNETLNKWIPEGWEVKKLEGLIDHQKGFAFKSSWYQEKGHIVVRVSDTTNNSINTNSCNRVSPEVARKYSSYALNINDLIIATVGSWPPNFASVVGKVIRVPSTAEGGLLNQNAVRITAQKAEVFNTGFLYFNLKEARFTDYIINRAQGSANQASITLKSIFNYPVLIASDSILTAYTQRINTVFDKQNLNLQQSQSLVNLREALLPQLISGKLRVPKGMLEMNENLSKPSS